MVVTVSVQKSDGFLQNRERQTGVIAPTVLIHSLAIAGPTASAAEASHPMTPRLSSIHVIAKANQQEVIGEMLVRDVAPRG